MRIIDCYSILQQHHLAIKYPNFADDPVEKIVEACHIILNDINERIHLPQIPYYITRETSLEDYLIDVNAMIIQYDDAKPMDAYLHKYLDIIQSYIIPKKLQKQSGFFKKGKKRGRNM